MTTGIIELVFAALVVAGLGYTQVEIFEAVTSRLKVKSLKLAMRIKRLSYNLRLKRLWINKKPA